MNTMNLKPAIRYQLEYIGKFFMFAFVIVAAVMALLYIILEARIILSIDHADGFSISTNLVSMITIMLFVIGIVGIREDLKMYLQFGAGRRTVFVSTLISTLITGVVLGLICELRFMIGFMMTAAGFFLAWQLGALISLIYYRLNLIGIIVFSVAGGAVMLFCLPFIIIHVSQSYQTFLLLPLLLFGALAAAGSFLLLRRAPVKE